MDHSRAARFLRNSYDDISDICDDNSSDVTGHPQRLSVDGVQGEASQNISST